MVKLHGLTVSRKGRGSRGSSGPYSSPSDELHVLGLRRIKSNPCNLLRVPLELHREFVRSRSEYVLLTLLIIGIS